MKGVLFALAGVAAAGGLGYWWFKVRPQSAGIGPFDTAAAPPSAENPAPAETKGRGKLAPLLTKGNPNGAVPGKTTAVAASAGGWKRQIAEKANTVAKSKLALYMSKGKQRTA